MGENSNIEWCHHTFNPWVGCTKISVGPQGACEKCYAEVWAKRAGHPELWQRERRRTTAANWRMPLKWNAAAKAAGIRARVFCASLADVFDNAIPQQWRDDLWQLITVTPHLDWLLLTKRIGNFKTMVPWYSYRGAITPTYYTPANVWIGATIANQEEADRDIPKLLQTPAIVRFLSCEPLLGPIDLERGGFSFLRRQVSPTGIRHGAVDWVIVGGESGPGARPMALSWARSLVDQCRTSGVATFVKQLGARPNDGSYPISDRKGAVMSEWPEALQVREFPEGNP